MTENEMIRAPIQTSAVLDLRSNFLSMTPEHMEASLADYDARRKVFRDWLKGKLVEGTHYGYPPGCEPESGMINGVLHYKNRGKWYPATQWTPKPSLYKPTADMLCECLALRDEYDADMDAWKQLGEPNGTFVIRCRLISMTSGELIGEGRGVRKNGQKGGDENNAIKMAKKSAKLDAVINALGISDLFTQDEPAEPPQYDNPAHDEAAPRAATRGNRVVESDLRALIDSWKEMRGRLNLSVEFDQYALFVEGETGMDRAKIKRPAEWEYGDLEKCRRGIEMQLSAYAAPKGDGSLFGEQEGNYAG